MKGLIPSPSSPLLPPSLIKDVILTEEVLEGDQTLLPSLPFLLLLSHYEEDLTWLTSQPHPAIIYEKKAPRTPTGWHYYYYYYYYYHYYFYCCCLNISPPHHQYQYSKW